MSGWIRGAGVQTLAGFLGGGGAEKVRTAYGGLASADTPLAASASEAKSSRQKAGAVEIRQLQEKLEEHMNEIQRLEADVVKYKNRNQEDREHTSGYKVYIAKREKQIADEKSQLKATVSQLGKPGMTAKMTQEEKQKLALARDKAGGYKAAEEATKARQEKAMATGVSKEDKEAKAWDKLGFPGGKKQATAYARGEYDKGTDTFGKGTGGGGGGGGGGGR
jgi:hypothetical protein